MGAEVAELVLFCIGIGIIIWIVELRSTRLEDKIDHLTRLINAR